MSKPKSSQEKVPQVKQITAAWELEAEWEERVDILLGS